MPEKVIGLKIITPRDIAGQNVAEGFMKFQFEPESVKESTKIKLNYQDALLEDRKVPTYQGRDPRVVTMTLMMLDRALARSNVPEVEATINFLKDEEGFRRQIREKRKSRENERNRITELNRQRSRIDAEATKRGISPVEAFTRGVTNRPQRGSRGGGGRIKFFPPPVQVVPPEFRTQEILKAGKELAHKADIVAGESVERQLNWLRTVQRSFPEFGDRPPGLILTGMFNNRFFCLLESLRIEHLAVHPITKKTTYAKASITLKEAFQEPTFSTKKE